ncbi:MAG: hypothetical protein AABX38_02875 [Candidatus Micrarchaeota archaeon]
MIQRKTGRPPEEHPTSIVVTLAIEGISVIPNLKTEDKLRVLLEEELASKEFQNVFTQNQKRFEILDQEIKDGNNDNVAEHGQVLSDKLDLERTIASAYEDFKKKKANILPKIESLLECARKIEHKDSVEIIYDLEFLEKNLDGTIKDLEEELDGIEKRLASLACIDQEPAVEPCAKDSLSFMRDMSVFPLVKEAREKLFGLITEKPELEEDIETIDREITKDFSKVEAIKLLSRNSKREHKNGHLTAENWQNLLIVKQVFENFIKKNPDHYLVQECKECLELKPFREAEDKLKEEINMVIGEIGRLATQSQYSLFFQKQKTKVVEEGIRLDGPTKSYIVALVKLYFEFTPAGVYTSKVLEKLSSLEKIGGLLDKFNVEEQISQQFYERQKQRLAKGIMVVQTANKPIVEANKLELEFKTLCESIELIWQKISNFKVSFRSFQNNGILSEQAYQIVVASIKRMEILTKQDKMEEREVVMASLDTNLTDLKEKETTFIQLRKSLDYVLTKGEEPGLLQGILKITEVADAYEDEAISIIVQKVDAILDRKSKIPKPSSRAISETLQKFIENRKRSRFTNDELYLQAKRTLDRILKERNDGFWSIFRRSE